MLLEKSQARQESCAGNLSPAVTSAQPRPLPRGPRKCKLGPSRAVILPNRDFRNLLWSLKIIFSLLKLQKASS